MKSRYLLQKVEAIITSLLLEINRACVAKANVAETLLSLLCLVADPGNQTVRIQGERNYKTIQRYTYNRRIQISWQFCIPNTGRAHQYTGEHRLYTGNHAVHIQGGRTFTLHNRATTSDVLLAILLAPPPTQPYFTGA